MSVILINIFVINVVILAHSKTSSNSDFHIEQAYSGHNVGLSIPFVTLNFTGARNAFSPPDTMGVIGDSQYLLGTNYTLYGFNKVTGAPMSDIANVTWCAFFGTGLGFSCPNNYLNYITDAKIKYDRFMGKWIISAMNDTSGVKNTIYIAISKTSNISSFATSIFPNEWSFYYFDADQSSTNCMLDNPSLAIDIFSISISGNTYCNSTSNYLATNLFVITKRLLPDPPTNGRLPLSAYTRIWNVSGWWSPQGVDNYDDQNPLGFYFVGTPSGSFDSIVKAQVAYPIALISPLSAVQSITTNVSTSHPVPVMQPTFVSGNTFVASTIKLDGALLGSGAQNGPGTILNGGVLRKGTLWTLQTIGTDSTCVAKKPNSQNIPQADRDGIVWYKINNFNSAQQSVQSGTICNTSSSAPLSYWMPSLMVSGQDHVLFGMSESGVGHYPDAALARYLTTPVPAETTPVALTNSSKTYMPQQQGNLRRWGDYSSTTVDPCDDMTMWTSQEFAYDNSSWGIQVAKVSAPAPSTPIFSTPIIDNDHIATQLTVVSSGLFDPGYGKCRLTITADGGLNIYRNSITYNTNTRQVSFSVGTCGIQAGTKNIQFTNPDGQRAVGQLQVQKRNPSSSECYKTDFVGLYELNSIDGVSSNVFRLLFSDRTGSSGTVFSFGSSTHDYPVVGDWNSDYLSTPGIYDTSNGLFVLCNTLVYCEDYRFVLGIPGDMPLVGHWIGATHDGVGVFRPSNGLIYLKNDLTTGFADYTMVLGVPGDVGIAGDWDGNGASSPGVYRPQNGKYYLSNNVCNCSVFGDIEIANQFGINPFSLKPVIGRWTGNNIPGYGGFISPNTFYLRNSLDSGLADTVITLLDASSNGGYPVAGHWVDTFVASAPRPVQDIIITTSQPTQIPTRLIPTPQSPRNFDG